LEHRISGADTNPYLALTAVLGGILQGLETKPPLQPGLEDPGWTPAAPLQHDWMTAVQRFEQAPCARSMFGDAYCALYAAVKRDEIAAVQDPIPPSEYQYYLSRM
jgi:glutamine synthetase